MVTIELAATTSCTPVQSCKVMRFLTLPDSNASSGLQALPTFYASTDSTCKGTLLWKVGHEDMKKDLALHQSIVGSLSERLMVGGRKS
jgi:hypothetical protein